MSLRRFSLLMVIWASVISLSQANELGIQDLREGTGIEAQPQFTLEMHYTGWLEDGTQFDSSHDRGQPLSLVLGQGQVIPGWEIGIRGMKVGGKRELIIPPALAYGARGAGNVIPPNATLRFEVELVSAEPPPFSNVNNDELQALIDAGTKVIDIRRPDEWQQSGVVPGSYLMTAFDEQGRFIPQFAQSLSEVVSQDESFVIICRVGNRTGVLARAMVEQGVYPNVQNVTEGIVSWIGEQREVRSQCPSLESGSRC